MYIDEVSLILIFLTFSEAVNGNLSNEDESDKLFSIGRNSTSPLKTRRNGIPSPVYLSPHKPTVSAAANKNRAFNKNVVDHHQLPCSSPKKSCNSSSGGGGDRSSGIAPSLTTVNSEQQRPRRTGCISLTSSPCRQSKPHSQQSTAAQANDDGRKSQTAGLLLSGHLGKRVVHAHARTDSAPPSLVRAQNNNSESRTDLDSDELVVSKTDEDVSNGNVEAGMNQISI